MKTASIVAIMIFSCFRIITLAQETDPLHSQSDIPLLNYKLVSEWPLEAKGDKGFPSGPWNYWQVPSVAVEKNGNVLVLHRGEYPILEYDPSGKFIGTCGDVSFSEGKIVYVPSQDRNVATMSAYQAVYGPAGCMNCGAHEIRTDPAGNIWVVDATAEIIYKMNPHGHVIMTIGSKGKSGLGPNLFYFPTDVAFAPDGAFYVSDGYGNARVAKFSRNGRFLLSFGERGEGPGQFQLPHNVVVDAKGKVYVTDRDNHRVEVFDANGVFISEWDNIGKVNSLVITRDQHIWTGGILRDVSGRALGRLPLPPVTGGGPHGAAVDENGDIYFGELSGRVEKFVKQ